MEDQLIKTDVISWLESRGFTVSELPLAHDKSPDLRAHSNGESFLIEVKTKMDDPAELCAEAATLERGEVYHNKPQTTGRRNLISGIVSKGVLQLSSKLLPGEFAVLWFQVAGHDPQTLAKQAFASFYGTQWILERMPHPEPMKRCFYFENSDFYSHKDVLSAAVIHEMGYLPYLCINDLHSRTCAFRNSSLCRAFGKLVCDPKASESLGESYYVDADVDRKSPAVVLEFLRNKYRTAQLLNVVFKLYEATSRVSYKKCVRGIPES